VKEPRPRAHYGNDKSVFLSNATMMSSVSVGFPLARCLFVCGWRFQFSGQSRWPVAKGGLGSGLRIPGLRTCPSSFRLSGDIYDTLPAAAEVPNKCNLNWGIPPVNTISVVEVVWVGMTSRINSRKCHYSNSLKEQEVSINFQLRDVYKFNHKATTARQKFIGAAKELELWKN